MALRTGIVGAGTVSMTNYLPAVARNPRTDLVAVADRDGEAAREAGRTYGAGTYRDVDRMLAAESLDWVHVATSVDTHRDVAVAALEAGVPVAIQKPAATTRADLEEIVSAATEHDVPASVIHGWLYYPVVREARRRVDRGDLGRVRGVEVAVTGEGRPAETRRGSWVFDLPGADFEEGLPRPLSIALSFAGYPSNAGDLQATARSAREYDRDVDYDGAALQYVSRSGTLCSVTILSGSARNDLLRVYGDGGSLSVDLSSSRLEAHDEESGPYRVFEERLRRGGRQVGDSLVGVGRTVETEALDRAEERLDWHREDSVDGHYHLIDRAARALQAGRRPPVPLEHARWTLAMLESVREAAGPTSGAPRSSEASD